MFETLLLALLYLAPLTVCLLGYLFFTYRELHTRTSWDCHLQECLMSAFVPGLNVAVAAVCVSATVYVLANYVHEQVCEFMLKKVRHG